MHQNNFLFVTGFSSKPEILQRNHSFLNDPKQSGSENINAKKNKIDFVQRNKVIIKLSKTQNTQNASQNQAINPQNSTKTQESQPKKVIHISKRLNQSVGYEDSSEINSEIMKLSQSFDFKMMKAKKILRRIIPKEQQAYQGQHSLSVDQQVEDTKENQTKFRTNYLRFEHDKENHDMNNLRGGESIETYTTNDKLNQISSSLDMVSSNSLNNISVHGNKMLGKVGIKCATQPDLDTSDYGINTSENIHFMDLLKEQEVTDGPKKSSMKSKNQSQMSTHEIVKDSYFSQDNKIDEQNNKQLQNIIQQAKKKCPDIRSIMSNSIGDPMINMQDISINSVGGDKNIKTNQRPSNFEQNLIEAYQHKQKNLKNTQTVIIKKQGQGRTLQNLGESSEKANSGILDNNSTITFNQKNTIEEKNNFIDQGSNYQNENMKNVSYDTLMKNEEQRIQQLQQRNIKRNILNTSVEITAGEESQQIDSTSNQNETVSEDQNQNGFKHQHRVILNRKYDYQIGIKNNPTQNQPGISSKLYNAQPNSSLNDKLHMQYQIYSQSPLNPFTSSQGPPTTISALQDKSTKSNSSVMNKGVGQMRQNLIIFENNKKKEVNVTQSTPNSNSFSMGQYIETMQDTAFQPQTIGKSPFRSNITKQIINGQPNQKKFNFYSTSQNFQNQQNIMNAYLDASTRVSTEPVTYSIQSQAYTPLTVQKKINQEKAAAAAASQNALMHRQNTPGQFNNFLEEFNLDNISIGISNKIMTQNSSKSKRMVNKLNYQLEVNSKVGTTPLSLQNKSNAVIKNAIRFQSSSQQGQYKANTPNSQNNQQNYNYVKSASSLGFNEAEQNYHHNIISNPPLLSLSQDSISDGNASSKHLPYTVYGNSMPIPTSTQSGSIGGQNNSVFEFHEVQQQHNNYRSLSQQSNRSAQKNLNLSFDLASQQGNRSISQASHGNLNSYQNFQPSSLNVAPPSCSSAQSLFSTRYQNQIQSKLNQSIRGGSSKNLGEQNQTNFMREMYTELDEDVRIFDFSPKKILALKQNQLQRSTIMQASQTQDLSSTNMSGSVILRNNTLPPNQTSEFKQYSETAKLYISKLENTNKPNDSNNLMNSYLDSVRTRITQLKNKKKNTEIDLILQNTKLISDIENANTFHKQFMPHNLSQQLDELYQQIKKNIFIYSCQ